MIRIVCSNPSCPAPNRTFTWNERPDLGAEGRLSKEEEPSVISFVVECPFGHPNKIWVKNVRKSKIVRKF